MLSTNRYAFILLMRLYRGLKEPYRPSHGLPQRTVRGSDFTDCPYVATQYASTRRGVVLVLDVTDDRSGIQQTEELWLHSRAKRFMISGEFDRFIVGIVPAKDLRGRLRQKGLGGRSEEDKALVLEWFIRDAIAPRRSRAITTSSRVEANHQP